MIATDTEGTFEGDIGLPGGTVGTGASAAIRAMNPAHIVVEALTNPLWGRGLPFENIDEPYMKAAADIFFAEKMGLCMAYKRTDDLGAFIQSVCDHAGAAVFLSRSSGKMRMVAIRPGSPTAFFDKNNGLLSVEQDDTNSADTDTNEVVVTFRDPVSNKDATVRAQNLAAFQSVGSVISQKTSYPGIPTKALGNRVAQRDLHAKSLNLKRLKVKLDRRGWEIEPGSIFSISAPERGIVNMVLRAVDIDDGDGDSDEITVACLQDQFNLPSTAYTASQPSTNVPTPRAPVSPGAQRLVEASYRQLARELTAADLNAVDADDSYIVTYAARPTGLSLGYNLWTAAAGEAMDKHGVGDWTPTAILTDDLEWDDDFAHFNAGLMLDNVKVGDALLIDAEICRIDAIDLSLHTVTLARGCVDTVPAPHPANTRMWFIDDGDGTDRRAYASVETVTAKVLTRTNAGILDPSLAPVLTRETTGRQGRPYPPANFKVGGTPFLDIDPLDVHTEELVLTWAHRDRVGQADQLVEWTAGNVGPEPGVTYTVRVYGEDADPISEHTGLTTPTFTYTTALAGADGDPYRVRLEVTSVRDEIESYPVEVTVRRSATGWGLGWGQSWGA